MENENIICIDRETGKKVSIMKKDFNGTYYAKVGDVHKIDIPVLNQVY